MTDRKINFLGVRVSLLTVGHDPIIEISRITCRLNDRRYLLVVERRLAKMASVS